MKPCISSDKTSKSAWQLVPALAVLLCLNSCVVNETSINQSQAVAAPATVSPELVRDEQQVLAAQQAQARKTQVTVCAPVYKLLPDDRKGLPHQRFLIKLVNGTTVLIAHDLKLAPYIPLKAGDFVRIHGEYIWNEKGGVIHWTHHDPRGWHDPGWIDYNGQRYQ